jgi:flagellar hook-associated protein 2
MSIERQPIDKLNTKITSYETKISSFGTISGLVSSFQTAVKALNTSISANSVTSADGTIVTGSAGSTAVPGTYALEVSYLAQSQNLVAAGQTSSTAAIGNGTATTVTFDFGTISGGTLTSGTYSGATFTSNGSGATSITIDGTNNTLEGIRDAINAANFGVTATIVNDGSATPYRLALTSTSSGVSNSIKITTSGGDGTIGNLLGYNPAGVQNLNQTVAAQNASFTVNGIAISKTSNTVSDAIQGVTFTLGKQTTGPVNLTVAHDTSAINTAASSFVEAYNALYNQLKTRSAYGTSTSQAPALAGDGTVRIMMSQLHGIFNTAATGGTLAYLTEVGISANASGQLTFTSSKLSSAIATDFADVTNLFTSTSGFATRLDDWATSVLSAGGLIDSRTTSLNTSIKDFNDQISKLEVRMAALQRLYTAQYSNLNMLLSSMDATSTYLNQQFAKSSGA